MATSQVTKDINIIHRFSDVAGEPCIMLPPIEGFCDKPLVSLEEAVEPLISIVQDVKAKVSIAKECANNPSHDLTINQSASIALYTIEWEPYTKSLYYLLNSALRSEDREELKPWLLYLKLILTALTRLRSIRLTVYRALKLDTKVEYERYEEGKEIIWWGFSSCTTNKHIAEKGHFLCSKGTRTLFIVECLQGKDIGQHSRNKNNQEILLLPGTRFDILRCDRRRDDFHKIYMREVDTQSLSPQSNLTTSVDQSLEGSSPETDTQSSKLGSARKFLHQFLFD